MVIINILIVAALIVFIINHGLSAYSVYKGLKRDETIYKLTKKDLEWSICASKKMSKQALRTPKDL